MLSKQQEQQFLKTERERERDDNRPGCWNTLISNSLATGKQKVAVDLFLTYLSTKNIVNSIFRGQMDGVVETIERVSRER